MKIAVIGAGNGGQALAGYLASIGNEVIVSALNQTIVDVLRTKGGIQLEGKINAYGKLAGVTCDATEAIKGAELIMVATTATAHASLAKQLSNSLEEGQTIILNPGRTGGAIEFRKVLLDNGFDKRIYLAEAQTLVYACRLKTHGSVNIIGIKDKVYLSGLPASDTKYIIDKISPFFNCFMPCKNVLVTSLENYGAVFHPSIVLFNAAAIERGSNFYFYREMTPCIADFLDRLDAERVAVGKAYGIEMIRAKDWVSFAYDNIQGDTLCERLKSNPAYYDILAPGKIDCRQITEDIPTGAVPLLAFGKAAGLEMPLYTSLVGICSALLNTDFNKTGRSLERLGLKNRNREEILAEIQ